MQQPPFTRPFLGVEMDSEILNMIAPPGDDADAAAYAEECVAVYEDTLDAMGVFEPEPVTGAIDNSKVDYCHQPAIEYGHADVSEDH